MKGKTVYPRQRFFKGKNCARVIWNNSQLHLLLLTGKTVYPRQRFFKGKTVPGLIAVVPLLESELAIDQVLSKYVTIHWCCQLWGFLNSLPCYSNKAGGNKAGGCCLLHKVLRIPSVDLYSCSLKAWTFCQTALSSGSCSPCVHISESSIGKQWWGLVRNWRELRMGWDPDHNLVQLLSWTYSCMYSAAC